jgi:hypothetical protein
MESITSYPEIVPYSQVEDILALWPDSEQRTSVNVLDLAAGSARLSQGLIFQVMKLTICCRFV